MGLQRVRHDRATEHALTHITACIVKMSGMKSQSIAKSVLTAVTAADCFLAAAVVLMEDIQHRPQTGQKCRLSSCTQTCRIRTAGWVQRSVLTSLQVNVMHT